jgi:hypothetical protein
LIHDTAQPIDPAAAYQSMLQALKPAGKQVYEKEAK